VLDDTLNRKRLEHVIFALSKCRESDVLEVVREGAGEDWKEKELKKNNKGSDRTKIRANAEVQGRAEKDCGKG
jgi:hypothetical protein